MCKRVMLPKPPERQELMWFVRLRADRRDRHPRLLRPRGHGARRALELVPRPISAALVHWKKSPAALFVPVHPWTAPFGSTFGRPNALLRVCRTSASFPLAKSVVFASCVAGDRLGTPERRRRAL